MSTRYFPWRIFRQFYFALVGLLFLCFVATMGIGALFFNLYWAPGTLALVALIFFCLALMGSALLAYRFVLPLRRVILKALRLASKKQAMSLGQVDEDLFDSEPGEYFELERALDKIRRKMKKRRLELAHEREESQALMSFLQDAVVSVGLDGKIHFFNSRFATLFMDQAQLKPQNENQALLLTNLFRDPEILKKIEKSAQSGLIERFQQKMSTMLDPQGRFFSVTVSPLREEKSRAIYGILVLFHDISDLKKAEQIRIEFVENASHELRTPLTSIKGFLETAREDMASGQIEQVPQFLEKISRGVDRVVELVNDMLTLSSLENSAGLNLDLIQPEMLTQEVFEYLSGLASDKKIMLKVNDESEPFRADPVLVERVLLNLIGNAIKYVQDGGQIEVRWELQARERKVFLHVKDNGPGISEEHLDRLFERFYRIDKGRSRDVGGTGLGLSIVKHIMQSHGGSVRAVSRMGLGAEFICEFPFRN